jgi:hypothetical protein
MVAISAGLVVTKTDRQATQEAGFEAHLTKPTDPDVLERRLRTIGESVRQERPLWVARAVRADWAYALLFLPPRIEW